jgi:hypothetical protein
MRVRSNRLYPYPVLSNNSDDFINNRFDVSKDIEYNNFSATVVLKTTIEDSTILDFIKDKKIGMYCNIECSVTKYRYMFEVPYDKFDEFRYDIDISELNENIEIACILVAKEDINFISDNLNNFYKNEVIYYPKYSTIGYTDTDEISLIKAMDINGDIPSIFTITSSEKAKEIYYDLSQNQINIFIPREEYEIYYNSRGDSKRLKQMMINLPVLEAVLNDIKKSDDSYDQFGWYKVLEDSIKNFGYDSFDDDSFKNGSDSFKLAQNILGNISSDAFKEFEKLRMKGE